MVPSATAAPGAAPRSSRTSTRTCAQRFNPIFAVGWKGVGRAVASMAAMKTTFLLIIISALLMSTGVASAATRQYEGTVASVNRDAKTFRLHDSERGTIRIKVRNSTRFERIDGFAGLTKGLKRVEATVKRSNGRWVAVSVQRSGGGHHGGDDD